MLLGTGARRNDIVSEGCHISYLLTEHVDCSSIAAGKAGGLQLSKVWTYKVLRLALRCAYETSSKSVYMLSLREESLFAGVFRQHSYGTLGLSAFMNHTEVMNLCKTSALT